MKEKIELLMEETGCDRGEAELALEMCGYEVEEAVRRIPRLLRDICALKGKFLLPSKNQHGLVLVILNLKTRNVLRARAVMSYDPAVCAVGLDEEWFAFEKHLYGCRLWDGSLPAESLEVEQHLAAHFRAAPPETFERLREASSEVASKELAEPLRSLFGEGGLSVRLKKDILDLGQFQSLRKAPTPTARRDKPTPPVEPAEDLLVLKIALEEDLEGVPAPELRAGDLVFARIVDGRDIAKYLARLFGGLTASGPVPIEAPVEAVESVSDGVLVRVRFAVGVAGDVVVPADRRLKASRGGGRGDGSWWRRFFKG
ncbi:MAG: hypothetical protein A2X40_07825 [Elusimicrobia bacterium GWC2_65_9]|nr:MAG: hypothetical protein A2X37_08105 [Elusimicrobia bacterium GWA2_66_18]OGR72838.1 MAG: hypothetical protein A2X40_07825 [Elusimicrobia bacterium GWC2_65_9]